MHVRAPGDPSMIEFFSGGILRRRHVHLTGDACKRQDCVWKTPSPAVPEALDPEPAVYLLPLLQNLGCNMERIIHHTMASTNHNQVVLKLYPVTLPNYD